MISACKHKPTCETGGQTFFRFETCLAPGTWWVYCVVVRWGMYCVYCVVARWGVCSLCGCTVGRVQSMWCVLCVLCGCTVECVQWGRVLCVLCTVPGWQPRWWRLPALTQHASGVTQWCSPSHPSPCWPTVHIIRSTVSIVWGRAVASYTNDRDTRSNGRPAELQ